MPAVNIGQALPPRRFPVRTCVACRTERQKREFVRIVRTPDGTVTLDTTGRASGRGAYLCADGSCWAAAIKKKAIERALSAPLPAELRAQLERGPVAETAISGGDADGS
ncbi:MAG: RNase P modulator RnpM [Candidatus Limnocylindrales bacterium]